MGTRELWYFAYGSNMSRSVFLGRRRMHPIAARRGFLDHYRLCFDLPIGPGERGVANIEPAPGARTHGVLWLISAEEFDRLDRTEAVHIGVYQRVPVEVTAEAGERLAAFTYRSTAARPGRKPSARYMRLLLEGASEHGLPADHLEFLASFELAVDERESVER